MRDSLIPERLAFRGLRSNDHICLEMKKHNQITLAQRYEIQGYLTAGKSTSFIAEQLDVHPSTVYRELNRNSDQRNGKYKAELAENKCRSRHSNKPKKVLFTPELIEKTESLLRKDYSPEQIVGHLTNIGQESVSIERIYTHIWSDKKQGGKLYKHLRNRGKRYRKRGGGKDSRGLISNRLDISKRPAVVEEKKRLGDMEVDTVIGKDHKGALVTINCRATGMLKMELVKTKEAYVVSKAILNALEEWKPWLQTITSDNGKEFANHEQIARELDIGFYFAQPYHSWERGANENLNGLVRQYFPKGSDFSKITPERVKEVEAILNERPRKRHKFRSPNQMMAALINQTSFSHL